MSYCIIVSETVMELEPLTVDELKTTGYAQNILRKFECLISQGENALRNL